MERLFSALAAVAKFCVAVVRGVLRVAALPIELLRECRWVARACWVAAAVAMAAALWPYLGWWALPTVYALAVFVAIAYIFIVVFAHEDDDDGGYMLPVPDSSKGGD